jgi:hypothetical protein
MRQPRPALAPSAALSRVSLLEHEITTLQREVDRLKALVYVNAEEPATTWQERAAQLVTQLEQAAPGASKQLTISRLSDEHDCETCGSSWAEGAEVRLNGNLILNLVPCASCFGDTSYGDSEVLLAILEHIGYAVTYDSALLA